MRGEIRRGFSAHEGIIGNFSADAFADITPEVRVSGGPRMWFGNSDYFDAYYGVSPAEVRRFRPEPLFAEQRRRRGRRRRRDRLENDRQADHQRLRRIRAAHRPGRQIPALSKSAARPIFTAA